MKPFYIGCLIVLGLAILVGGCAAMAGVSGYNQAKTLDQKVQSQWAEVEVQLQCRFDMIPQLEATVKGVAGQEQKVFRYRRSAQGLLPGRQRSRQGGRGQRTQHDAFATVVVAGELSAVEIERVVSQVAGFDRRNRKPALGRAWPIQRGGACLEPVHADVSQQILRRTGRRKPAEYLKGPETAKEPPKIEFSKP